MSPAVFGQCGRRRATAVALLRQPHLVPVQVAEQAPVMGEDELGTERIGLPILEQLQQPGRAPAVPAGGGGTGEGGGAALLYVVRLRTT